MSRSIRVRAAAMFGELSGREKFVIALALSAAAIRLIPLQWLHPLQWDELEFFRATRWVADGKVPFRDFWEHHTPLSWLVFAPLSAISGGHGVGAVIFMRWAQVPLWVAAFVLMNSWMAGAGRSRLARFGAVSLALSSSMFMIQAVEYRVEALACALLAGALVLLQRGLPATAGLLLALTVFANLRFAPAVAALVLLSFCVDASARRWTFQESAWRVVVGGLAGALLCVSYLHWTESLAPFVRHVWFDNLAEQHSEPVTGAFLHRLLVPFGYRLIGSGSRFEVAAFDAGGVALLLLGAAGIVLAFATARRPRHELTVAGVTVSSLAFIAWMKFVYNYHFALIVLLLLPLAAAVIDALLGGLRGARSRRAGVAVVAVVAVSWGVNLFASVFRGKELDRAYQDRIMREVHQRTRQGESVWSGVPWALHREPTYHFWFLPELARQLVLQGLAEPLRLGNVVANPPAAVIFDHNALVWTAMVQRELAPFFARHYVPVWRNLWIPGLNARLEPGGAYEWIVPRDGEYRMHGSSALARHLWFHNPILFVTQKGGEGATSTLDLRSLETDIDVSWSLDGVATGASDVLHLRKGQRIRAVNQGAEPVAVILLGATDDVLFRQPPPGVTLEGETSRVTHFPRIGARIE